MTGMLFGLLEWLRLNIWLLISLSIHPSLKLLFNTYSEKLSQFDSFSQGSIRDNTINVSRLCRPCILQVVINQFSPKKEVPYCNLTVTNIGLKDGDVGCHASRAGRRARVNTFKLNLIDGLRPFL